MSSKSINHIAIIPDGNRRWAKENNLISLEGHKKGAERIREIIDVVFREKISHLTIWLASTDNLVKRSLHEIGFLTDLFIGELQDTFNTQKFFDNKIKFKVLGYWKRFLNNEKLSTLISKVEGETKDFNERNLTLLFGYDGQEEMIEVVKKLKTKLAIDKKTVKEALLTGELPLVDLVIRTGGEPHWSAGFMMWHTSDSQFYFTSKFWPDFNESEFEKAVSDFASRERRFGR